MNSFKSASFGLAMVALVGVAGFAQSASAMKMSSSEKKMMHSCMAMPNESMMKDSKCMAMMKKMKMSDADMKMMMSCKAMSKDDMAKDQHCSSMMKMHPGMMTMGKPQ